MINLFSKVFLGGDGRKDLPAPALKFRIWSVNKWLRYTGIRLYVERELDEFTCIGLAWVGLPGSKGWERMEPKPTPPLFDRLKERDGETLPTWTSEQLDELTDDVIGEWHDGVWPELPLHEALGLTWAEYARWVECKITMFELLSEKGILT